MAADETDSPRATLALYPERNYEDQKWDLNPQAVLVTSVLALSHQATLLLINHHTADKIILSDLLFQKKCAEC